MKDPKLDAVASKVAPREAEQPPKDGHRWKPTWAGVFECAKCKTGARAGDDDAKLPDEFCVNGQWQKAPPPCAAGSRKKKPPR